MKKWLLAAAIALLSTSAQATCSGVFKPGTLCGNNTLNPSVPFEIPASSGITGPGSSTPVDYVIWLNSAGTQLGDKAPAAFNTVNDSNVTITLTGSPSTSLFNPVIATMGWAGQLPVSRGGTGISTGNSGGIPYFSSTTTMASTVTLNSLILGVGAGSAPVNYAGTSCTNQFLRALSNTGVGTCAAVNLTSDVINVLPIANGGTGGNTAANAANNILPIPTHAGDIIYWNGSAWITLPGNTTGTQVLQENNVGVPSWVTITGTGTVTSITPGSGIVSAVTSNCSQTPITSTGTVSSAECVNAQVGTTYTLADTDRAKLVTGTNAAAQAYTLPQAGASSQFMAGWWAQLQNQSTAPAAIITITTTISTLCGGGQTLLLYPGEIVKLISDGTNYQCSYIVAANGPWHLLNVLTAAASANLSDTTSITSAFTEYELVFEQMIPATNSVISELQVQSGGVFQTTSYLSSNVNGGSSTTSSGSISTGILVGTGSLSSSSAGVSSRMLLSNPAATATCKYIHGTYINITAGILNVGVSGGCWNSSGAITGVRFLMSAGNITSGTMKIYGRVN